MAVRTRRTLLALVSILLVGVAVLPAMPASADNTPQTIPFSQNWTNTGLITVDNNWSGVPGIIGYRGDDLTTATGTDPQTIVADGSGTPVNVEANESTPNTFATGGVAEFHILNPVVALNGSGTADAPHIVLHLNTTGETNINVAYNLRDLDGSVDNAVMQVALQYRVGSSGNFTNLPAGYVSDATTGPSQATLVTPVSANLPPAAENQSLVQVRVITANAVGNDEWVGIDDIVVDTNVGDAAPFVNNTVPADNATNVPVNSNIDITFSEPVDVVGAWFDITCGTSGNHTGTTSGGPTTYTINPDTNFANSETCTVTIREARVFDQDTNDPPDRPATDYVFDFTTAAPPPPLTEISAIQQETHVSSLDGTLISTSGIVTATSTNGFWIQDPTPDANDATSEGIFVFTSSAPGVLVGDAVTVTGTVDEFRPGGASTANLTTTEITNPGRTVTVDSSGNPLPPTTIVGTGGRVPPNVIIEDDSSGNVETSNTFDPAQDGIDFWESLEGMRLQLNNARATGPSNSFNEISVVGDDGANAVLETPRGGVVLRPNDFNPERILLDDVITGPSGIPDVNTGDHFTTPVVGVLDYSFGNFKLLITSALTRVADGPPREVVTAPGSGQLAVATYNVENLDPSDGAAKFAALADQIVNNLGSPDLMSIEEIQDNDGAAGGTGSPVVDASTTWNMLIDAILAEGGPTYDYRQIDPVDDQEGGEPGGNIRVGFLFRTDRGLEFVDRPGGTSTNATDVTTGPDGIQLTFSPGRIDPNNPAWSTPSATRRSLAGEFLYGGTRFFAIANHFKSKGGDEPLFGRFQPPTEVTAPQRVEQAEVVNDFVEDLLATQAKAKVVVLGDINDFWFSNTVTALKGDDLTDLATMLPQSQRYSYVFDGNSQDLDHILVSNPLAEYVDLADFVHINAEYFDQESDHDPVYTLIGMPAPGKCSITGTNGPNVLNGTPGPDRICGRGGNDTINADDGHDIVEGGPDDDVLNGEGGDDRLMGAKGGDTMDGGSGDDVLRGGFGADDLDTQDTVSGNDIADGGASVDTCTVDPGDTVIDCP